MNKNDFEILSPTIKQKTEMKERLMLEAECLSTVQNGTGRVISVDADELIEAKPRTKKSDFVMKFATIAAAVAFVAVVSSFFIMNNNGVQTLASQESAGETVASEVSSDKPSDTTESSQQEENTENNTVNADNILSSALIQDMTMLDKNTIFATAENNYLLIDSDSHEIIKKISRNGAKHVQKIDNGFVLIDLNYDTASYDIYDVKGNLTKHVDIPKKPLESEKTELATYKARPVIDPFLLCVSTDGEKVVYHGNNGFCTNSIDLDNEIIIQPVEDFNGGFEEFLVMVRPILYEGDVVYGEAYKYNPEKDENEFYFAGYNLETKGWTVYYEMQNKEQIFSGWYLFAENSFLIVDAGADSRYTDGKLPYYVIGDTEMKEFVCEEGCESVRAFISDNAKYIVTHSEYWTETGEPLPSALKLYDVETGEILLTKEYAHNLQAAYIDEATRTLYVVCGTQFFTMNF